MLFFSMFAAIDAAERRCAAEIFEKYHKLVYGIAYGILKRPLDAEDALNEVMIHVMKNMERFSDATRNDIEAQLVIYTRNTAINLYNKNKRRNKVEVPITYVNDEENLEDMEMEDLDQRVEEIVLTQETKDIVKAYLKNLPIEYRDVIKLVYALGYSNVEAAKILHISPNAVGLRLYKAKKKLAEVAGGELIERI